MELMSSRSDGDGERARWYWKLVLDGDTLDVLRTTVEPVYVDGTRAVYLRATTGCTPATYVCSNSSTRTVIFF